MLSKLKLFDWLETREAYDAVAPVKFAMVSPLKAHDFTLLKSSHLQTSRIFLALSSPRVACAMHLASARVSHWSTVKSRFLIGNFVVLVLMKQVAVRETMKSSMSDIRIVVIGEQNLSAFLRANKKTRRTIVNTPPTFRSDRTTLQAKFHTSVVQKRLSV